MLLCSSSERLKQGVPAKKHPASAGCFCPMRTPFLYTLSHMWRAVRRQMSVAAQQSSMPSNSIEISRS